MTTQYYIGLDVHKDTIAIAYISSQSREDATYHGTSGGSSQACERALRKLAKKLKITLQDFRICYEAGPTGFVLARHLISLGVECVLCSPSKTERKPSERVKTDKKDAQKLAINQANNQSARKLLQPFNMNLQDARTIPSEQLYERRLQAIALFKKNMTRTAIAEIVGVRRDVVGQWITKWQTGGLKALRVSKSGKPKGSGLILDASKQSKIQSRLIEKTPDQLKMNFALWTRHAVQQYIKQEFGLEIPIRTIGDYLKRWGFTPQKPTKRAYERNDKKVREWLKETYPSIQSKALQDNAEIHWGDETGISNRDQVGRGYAPKGKTPVRKHPGKRERINMISTVTKLGKIRFMFYEGRMNSDMLIKFFKRLTQKAPKKIFLILDNLPTHHSKPVKEWASKNSSKIELFYLPSYSPDLNPDEYLNRDLKAQLSKRPSKREKGEFTALAKTEMRRLQKSPQRAEKYFNSEKVSYAA